MAGKFDSVDGKTFAARVDAWILETNERMMAVTRDALNNLVDDASKPVAQGGQMRVDTGFLRASGRASLNQLPTGASIRPADAVTGQFLSDYDGDAVVTTLAAMEPGDTFYFGWTAEYAAVRDTFDGFLSLRLQNWQKYVDDSARRARTAAGDR